jgi:hypothetical protein
MSGDMEDLALVALARLRRRLSNLGLDVPEDGGKWHQDEETDELRIWWVIDGAAYAPHESGRIYVEHQVDGVYEWSLLDDDGQPIDWQREPPPWSSLN